MRHFKIFLGFSIIALVSAAFLSLENSTPFAVPPESDASLLTSFDTKIVQLYRVARQESSENHAKAAEINSINCDGVVLAQNVGADIGGDWFGNTFTGWKKLHTPSIRVPGSTYFELTNIDENGSPQAPYHTERYTAQQFYQNDPNKWLLKRNMDGGGYRTYELQFESDGSRAYLYDVYKDGSLSRDPSVFYRSIH